MNTEGLVEIDAYNQAITNLLKDGCSKFNYSRIYYCLTDDDITPDRYKQLKTPLTSYNEDTSRCFKCYLWS